MFYICDKQWNGDVYLYGIMDTNDSIVEYYTTQGVQGFMSLGIEIIGACNFGFFAINQAQISNFNFYSRAINDIAKLVSYNSAITDIDKLFKLQKFDFKEKYQSMPFVHICSFNRYRDKQMRTSVELLIKLTAEGSIIFEGVFKDSFGSVKKSENEDTIFKTLTIFPTEKLIASQKREKESMPELSYKYYKSYENFYSEIKSLLVYNN